MMDINARIFIAGHRGMVGSAVWRNLESKGFTNLIGRTSSELDLRNQQEVARFFETEKPQATHRRERKASKYQLRKTDWQADK